MLLGSSSLNGILCKSDNFYCFSAMVFYLSKGDASA